MLLLQKWKSSIYSTTERVRESLLTSETSLNIRQSHVRPQLSSSAAWLRGAVVELRSFYVGSSNQEAERFMPCFALNPL
jgi:hypothetical protein